MRVVDDYIVFGKSADLIFDMNEIEQCMGEENFSADEPWGAFIVFLDLKILFLNFF